MQLLQTKEQQLRSMLAHFASRVDQLEADLVRSNGDTPREVMLEGSISINLDLIVKISSMISGQTISRKQ